MEFGELNDQQWEFIRRELPPRARTGRPRADDRKVINGILYILITGCRWMDLPKGYGSYKTAWRRHKQLEQQGVWPRVLKGLLDWGYQEGKLTLGEVSVDATTIEAKKGGRG